MHRPVPQVRSLEFLPSCLRAFFKRKSVKIFAGLRPRRGHIDRPPTLTAQSVRPAYPLAFRPLHRHHEAIVGKNRSLPPTASPPFLSFPGPTRPIFFGHRTYVFLQLRVARREFAPLHRLTSRDSRPGR